MADASRDKNRVTTLLGISSIDGTTPTPIAVNPNTGALLIDGSSFYSSIDINLIVPTQTGHNGQFLQTDGSVVSWQTNGTGDVLGPATNHADYLPLWNGANSKTLKDGLVVPNGGLAGLTAPSFGTNISTPIIKPAADSTTAIQVTKADGSTVMLDIDTSNFRVGIGTVAPSSRFQLEMANNTTDQTQLPGFLVLSNEDGTVNNFSGIAMVQKIVGTPVYGATIIALHKDRTPNLRDTDILFSNIADNTLTEKMRILSTGPVGIGTSAPAAKLAINGGLHVGGDSDPGDNNILADGSVQGTKFIGYASHSKSFVITNPTTGTYSAVWRAPVGVTITAVHLLCRTQVVVGQLWQFDANGLNGATVDSSDITGVVDTNVNDDGSLSAPTITAGNYVGWHTTTATAGATQTIVTFEYTIT